jgi:diguanylate cyclase (GGDEF)-like protein
VDQSLEVPNGHWTLSLSPRAGWHDRAGLGLRIALGLAFSLLLAGLVESQVRLAADITELRRLREELERRATTDSLTGLANRGHFYDLAETHLARARRYGEELSLLILDIDHFKRVNDTYGHLAGDAVLRGVGEQCRQVIRASDLIGRMGGEEFAILLPSTRLASAIQLAERLRLRLRAQRWTTPQAKDLAITVSIGAASLTPVIATLDDLYARADQALYAAKTGGRDRVCSLDSLNDRLESRSRP